MTSPALYEGDDLGVGLAADTLPVDRDDAVTVVEAGKPSWTILFHLANHNAEISYMTFLYLLFV